MRIAQVAPLYESVPPRLYGGTERIVSWLTEALVQAGHEVTLFASGDSTTSAQLRSPCEKALRLHTGSHDPVAVHLLQFEMVLSEAESFDILHFHNEWLHFPLARRAPVATISTLHGRLDLPDYPELFNEYSELPVVSISQNQREPLAHAHWLGTVYHGLPVDHLPFSRQGGDYLAFLGRISPEKRIDRAVEIARRSHLKLKVAAKVDDFTDPYYESVKKELEDPIVEFIGEIGDDKKAEFLGGARALLFPIDWPEPFGLVMIESLACGTPVVAYRNGSVPEIIQHRQTGYIVETIEEAVDAVGAIAKIDRAECRHDYDRRFTVERMAADYVKLYTRMASLTRRRLRLPVHTANVQVPRGGFH